MLWCLDWLVAECPIRARLYEGSYWVIVVVVELGGVKPMCVRPGLYMTMRMFRCDSRP